MRTEKNLYRWTREWSRILNAEKRIKLGRMDQPFASKNIFDSQIADERSCFKLSNKVFADVRCQYGDWE